MAKTKKTIRKIIWDTERGIGVAREYTAHTPLFPLHDIQEAREANSMQPKQCVRIADRAPDPEKFSPHVLDLRHVHAARTTMPVFRPSLADRFFAVWNKKPHVSRDRTVTPLSSVVLPTLPAIGAKDIERHFSASERERGEAVWRNASPVILIREYPLLSQLSVGILLLLLAHFLLFIRPLLSFFAVIFSFFTGWFTRPLQPLRIVASTLRYYARRVRLEWESLVASSLPLHAAPVVLSPVFSVRGARRRTLSVFIILAIVLSIPFHAFSSYQSLPDVQNVRQKGIVLFTHVDHAISFMQRGAWQNAQSEWEAFRQGSEDLGASVYLTNPVIGSLGSFFSPRIRTGRAVIETAIAFADAGSAVTAIGETLTTDRALTDRLVRALPIFRDLVHAIDRIDAEFLRIDTAYLPAELQDNVARLPALLDDVKSTVRRVEGMVDLLPALLGHDRSMRYLVLFQNDAEARPTGGFIGSIGVVDIEKGTVRKIYMPAGGSYDVRGALRVNYRPPEPLQYVNSRFEFHDANWWPDFPTSARKLLALWDNAQAPTVDGVIAINASFFERLLAIVGPVDLPAYGKRIDAENFFLETQKAVEFEYDRKANTPKKFLRDLATVVLEQLGSGGNDALLPVALAFLDAVPERDVQAYLVQPALQEKVENASMSGAFMPLAPLEDSLRIVRTNIGGGKTDHAVRDTVTHTTAIAEDGAMEDSVQITRVHNGERGALFEGARSRDYLRVYVPKGSTLLRADGFSLPTRSREVPPDEYRDDPDLSYLLTDVIRAEKRVQVAIEGERTFFGGWVELNPGEVKTMTLTYRLPFSFAGVRVPTYRLRLEKQSGLRSTTIMHRTITPPSLALQDDTLPALGNPLPLKYDMTLLQTFQ